MQWPLERVFITQHFGKNPLIYSKFNLKGHNGVDFRTVFFGFTPKGHMHVRPLKPGVIVETGDQDIYVAKIRVKGKGYGLFVRINHDDGSQSVYAHFEKAYVKKGDRVGYETVIGLTGNTGRSTGPHLHVGYRPTGWEKLMKNGYAGYVDFFPLMIKN